MPLGMWDEDDNEPYLVRRKLAIEVHWELGTQRLFEVDNWCQIQIECSEADGGDAVLTRCRGWS